MTDDQRPEATPPPVTPPTPPAAPASSNRSVMIVLSYLWLLALIPLLTEQDDQDVRWHASANLIWAFAFPNHFRRRCFNEWPA